MMEKVAASNLFDELGASGLRQHAGYIREEFLTKLVGRQGARVYMEMRENDPVNSAVFHAIEMLLRGVEWWDEGAEGPDAEEATEFATQVREDMENTWADTVSDWLSMLQYGWCYAEIVLKYREGRNEDPTRDSKYEDGRVGIRSLNSVAQDTLDRWEFQDGRVIGLWQNSIAIGQVSRGMQQRFVPMEKALLFRTQTRKRNPEGRSILRGAYRPWYFKKRMEEIEAIGVERDLAGLPQIQPPENGPNLWDSNNELGQIMRKEAENLVRGIRRDEREGVVIPPGWELTLTSTGGRRQIDVGKIIERLARWQAIVALADVILIGHEKVGSYALADAKTNLLGVSLGAWLDMIAEVVNRFLYPLMFRVNGFRLDRFPVLRHGDLDNPDLDKLGNFVSGMANIGAITLGPEIEQHLRNAGGLPPKPEEVVDEELPEEEDPEDADALETNA